MAPSRTAAAPWPLIGRGDELNLIGRHRSQDSCAVVIAGSAGVGKTRLARELVAQAENGGSQTRWVQATRSAATVPLAAFAGVLDESAHADEPLELIRRSTEAMWSLGGRDGLVLAVDDAHALDPSSAALVLELATAGAAFVVATIRSGEPCPDAITSLWKDAGAARLELAPLGREETDRLVEEIVGGPVEQSARRWIHETSLGNALFVRELTLGALDGGALTDVRGLWRMADTPPLSASLAELIAARMAGLAEPEQRALELLAHGEPIRVGEMTALVSVPTLTAIEQRGLVLVSGSHGGAEVTLAHPVYSETIRASLPSFRAMQIKLELARRIGARPQLSATDRLRVTSWLLDAGEAVPTELLLEAAVAANRAGDPALSVKLAGRALAEGAGAGAALLLARAHVIRGEFGTARDVLAAAESTLTSQEEAGEYLEQQTAVLYWGLRRLDELREVLARARTWWDGAEWSERVRAVELMSNRDVAPGSAIADSEGLSRGPAADVSRVATVTHVTNLFRSGRIRDAYALARQIRPSLPLPDLVAEIAFLLWGVIAIESGLDWQELDAWATATQAEALRIGDRSAAARTALHLGGLRFLQGRSAEAARWLAEAEVQLERHSGQGLLLIANALQVGVASYRDDAPAVQTALARHREALGDPEPLPNQIVFTVLAESWAALSAGDPPHAQRLLLDGAERLDGMPIYAARLLYHAFRAGASPVRLAPALESCRSRCDARLTAVYAAHVAAHAAGDGHALLAVSEEMEAIGAIPYALEAAAHAATMFATAGRADSARRAAARSLKLHTRTDGAPGPRIEGVDDDAITLTARELQLVGLAARGRSNAEIAEQLVLSVRTVESHLYRAMHKLGVSDRRQL